MNSLLWGMEQAPSHKRKRDSEFNLSEFRGYVQDINKLRYSFMTMTRDNKWIVNAYKSMCNETLQDIFPDKYIQIIEFKNSLSDFSFIIDLEKFPQLARITLGNKKELGSKSEAAQWEALESISFIHTQLHILNVMDNPLIRERRKQLTWVKEFLEKYPLVELKNNVATKN